MRLIAYYPESERLARFYESSSWHRSEDRLVPIDGLRKHGELAQDIAIVGRHGNSHDSEIGHIRKVRAIRAFPHTGRLTLVCFDWHHDIDNEIGGTELTPGSWVTYGLENGVFLNAYILGASAGIDSEVDRATGEILHGQSMTLRLLDRLRLFEGVKRTACLRFDAAFEHCLADNRSVADYSISSDHSSVAVTCKTYDEVDYADLENNAFVSIDLDVLRDSEIKSDCPQGVWQTDDLIAAIRSVKAKTHVIGWGICGVDLSVPSIDQTTLENVAKVIGACTHRTG